MTKEPLPKRSIARTIPPRPSPEVRERLLTLLDQNEGWHLRGGWSAWLGGRWFQLTAIDELSRGQRIAAMAWLHQQRHALHRAIHGEPGRDPHIAPEGWIESKALYKALAGDPWPRTADRRRTPR